VRTAQHWKEQGAEGKKGDERADRKSKCKNGGVGRKKKEERVSKKHDSRKWMNEKMISTMAFTK